MGTTFTLARYPEDKSAIWIDFLMLKKDLGDGKWLVSWWVWDSTYVGKSKSNGHGIYMDHAGDHDIYKTESEIKDKYNIVPNFKLNNPIDIDI